MTIRRYVHSFLLLSLTSPSSFSQQEPYAEQVQSIEAFKAPVIRGALVGGATPMAAFSSTEKLVEIFDPATLALKSTLTALPNRISSLAFSGSGQLLATGIVDGRLMFWNTMTGVVAKTLSPHSGGVTNIVIQDENIILSTGIDNTFKVTDLSTGKTIGSLSVDKDEVSSLAGSPNGKMFAIGLGSGQVRIYNIAQLALLSTFTDSKDKITSLAFSPDGKYLAAGIIDGGLAFWDLQTRTLKTKLAAFKNSVSAIAFDPKGRWLVSASVDSTMKMTDLTRFTLVKTLRQSEGYVTYTAFANDETMITGTSKGALQRWRLLSTPPDTTNPGIALMRPPAGALTRVFAREYEILGVAYDDTEVKDVSVNGVAVSLTSTGGEEGAKIPLGFKGKKFVYTMKLDSVGVNPFQVKAVDKYNHVSYQTGYLQRLSNQEAVEVQTPENNVETDKVSTPIHFTAWFDVSNYSISVNMTDIVNGQIPQNRLAGGVIADEVPLVVGYNQIQLSVISKTGDQFTKTIGVNRKLSITTPPPSVAASARKGRKGVGDQAWAVVVGVSEYANPGIPGLKYADKDAEAFANFLRRPEGGGYDSDHLMVLLNKDATLGNLRGALINFLNQAIDKDLVVIYFAGHGAPEPARPQNLYLLTYDSDPNMLGTTAFPMWQIQDVLARYISAKRVVVFSDACHSGAISVNFATRGLGAAEDNLINQVLTDLSKSKEGTVIFTASAAGEVSQEFAELSHGVYTYFMLKGLEGEADYNNDYTITINELMQYVEEQVKRKTRGSQNPTRSQTMYDKEMTIATRPK